MSYSRSSSSRRGSAVLVIAIVLVIVLGAGSLMWLIYSRRGSLQTNKSLSAEAEAYYRNIAFSEVDMKAAESFAQQQLVEITGQVKNNGQRSLMLVEATAVFYDPYNNEVLRERVQVIRPRGGPMNPGDTRPFRLAFDNLPQNWNQQLPRLAIAHIEFAP